MCTQLIFALYSSILYFWIRTLTSTGLPWGIRKYYRYDDAAIVSTCIFNSFYGFQERNIFMNWFGCDGSSHCSRNHWNEPSLFMKGTMSTFESLVGHEEAPKTYWKIYKYFQQPCSHKRCLIVVCGGWGWILNTFLIAGLKRLSRSNLTS